MSILKDPKRMARLKQSIGTRTLGERPMTPVEVALAIEELINETRDPLEKIGDRLDVHADTCRMFLAILDFPKDWWDIWHFGQADGSGRLPFSMASKMGPKFKNEKISKNDLDILKGAALDPKQPARRDDINNILTCISKNPDKSIEKCIKEIMNLTPEKIPGFVMITDIDPKFVSQIRKKAEECGKSEKKLFLQVFSKYFSEEAIEDIRIKNDQFIQIVLSEKGHDEFYNLAKKENQLLKNLVNHIFSIEIAVT